jgi:hypothetical protein
MHLQICICINNNLIYTFNIYHLYITIHSASNISEQGIGSGQPAGVGHGGGVVRALSEHPHFLHPQVVQVLVAIV